MKAAASVIGAEITVVEATDSREIEAAFATLVRSKAGALVVGTDPFFTPGESSSSRWPRATRYRLFLMCASTRKRADC
jgi:hypothetical protein